MTHNSHRQGFTLIELSIVLVIIGLIVGGVLMGRDLIKASEIKASISQIASYNTALNTFRVKYNALPGDYSDAEAAGITQDASGAYVSCTNRNGDGNGFLDDDSHGGIVRYESEFFNFWTHLRGANLIADVTGTYGVAQSCASTITSGVAGVDYPKAKGVGETVVAVTQYDKTYFILGGFENSRTTSDLSYNPISQNAQALSQLQLTPEESMQIDTKIDDGAFNTGTVFTIWRFILEYTIGDQTRGRFTLDTAGGSSGCVTAGSEYNISRGQKSCTLAIRAN